MMRYCWGSYLLLSIAITYCAQSVSSKPDETSGEPSGVPAIEPAGSAELAKAEVPGQVGALAPVFECVDDQGQKWVSQEHVGPHWIVVYFYKSDFSFCCERQALRYRDNLEKLKSLRVEVVGISGDSVEAHAKFSSSRQLTFPLLSDETGHVATQFGVPFRRGGKAMETDVDGNTVFDQFGKANCFPRTVTAEHRCTFIIDSRGRILYRAENVSPIEDLQAVMDFIKGS